jgi:hypothetical protein
MPDKKNRHRCSQRKCRCGTSVGNSNLVNESINRQAIEIDADGPLTTFEVSNAVNFFQKGAKKGRQGNMWRGIGLTRQQIAMGAEGRPEFEGHVARR